MCIRDRGEGPREIIAANGKVYVSMYDGYVSRIDTLSLTIDATLNAVSYTHLDVYKRQLKILGEYAEGTSTI